MNSTSSLVKSSGLELQESDFIKSDIKIGEGPFAVIVKGLYGPIEVAVKVFNLKPCPPRLKSEFAVYCKASHPNLLKFYGVCFHPKKFAMITEIGHTNLNTYIKTFVSPKMTSHIAKGILKGVAHLHSIEFAHSYLTDKNVFVMENFEVKLGDFGLFNFKLEAASSGAAGPVTVRWRAPESFLRENAHVRHRLDVQKPRDMYAVGLLIWQMLSRKVPFEGTAENEVIGLFKSAAQQEMNLDWSPFYRTLLSNCWNLVPNERPTAIQALRQFENRDTSILLLFASTCGDKNVFAQKGMQDVLKNAILPLMFKIGN